MSLIPHVAAFDRADPVVEEAMCVADRVVQPRGRLQFELQPVVEGLFHRPRDFGQRLQANHPPAALERVEAAADGCQVGSVARIVDRVAEFARNRGQNLVGFFDEDAQQFGVESAVVIRRQGRSRLGRRQIPVFDCFDHCGQRLRDREGGVRHRRAGIGERG